MRKRLGVYKKHNFDKLINLIERVPGHQLDVRELMRALQSFVSDFGPGEPMTKAARLWAEADDAEQITPKQAVSELEKLLDADNPLARGVCPPALQPSLNAKIRRRWKESWREKNTPRPSSLTTVDWDLLTETERGDVYEVLEELRAYNAQLVKSGAPLKDRLGTALEEIGAIWIAQTGWNKALYELPHSKNSRFIQFASMTVRPCADKSETSQIALSGRWKRQKKTSF